MWRLIAVVLIVASLMVDGAMGASHKHDEDDDRPSIPHNSAPSDDSRKEGVDAGRPAPDIDSVTPNIPAPDIDSVTPNIPNHPNIDSDRPSR
jgi:hypothetical protein